MDLIFYLTVAAAGYFSTFSVTAKIVILRPPLDGHSVDYPIMISQVAIILVLIVAIPVNYNPFRNQLFYMWFKREEINFKE